MPLLWIYAKSKIRSILGKSLNRTLMSEWTCQIHTQIGSVKWLRKTIMWQEIIATLLSKYIRMKNHLTATHVKSNFYKLPISNAVMWKTISSRGTRNLQNSCVWMIMSEYTQIKNHLAASHWTWNFSELSTLLLTKTFHFQNNWNNIPGV